MPFERRHQKPAPMKKFIWRMVQFAVVAIIIVIGSLAFGAWGYAKYAGLKPIDALHAAALILFSEGPSYRMPTDAAKWWEIFYGCFSCVAFVSIVGTLLAPILHRIFHHFHLDMEEGK